jgi:hypothetical protein
VSAQEMANSMYFWGLAIAVAFILFYIVTMTWMVIVLFHDWLLNKHGNKRYERDDNSAQ